MKDDLKPATTPLPPLEPWVWRLPEHFNIGVACTDAHLGTPAAQKIAMIVEDDARGTAEIRFDALDRLRRPVTCCRGHAAPFACADAKAAR